ncbi:MAG: prepilin-type N-terminal cleavage/methylation domain-containing protein [Sumerlaeia bacterium]
MKNLLSKPGAEAKKAFTLIELLIVVAIIAILAAIAVPNFLEAQVRAKVSRILSDMRTIRTGLESYAVDTNKYPETDPTIAEVEPVGDLRGLYWLTTPISYLTSIPRSPFTEDFATPGLEPNAKEAEAQNFPLYVRARPGGTAFDSTVAPLSSDFALSYVQDRQRYLGMGGGLVDPLSFYKGAWLMKSVGPDNTDNRNFTTAPEGPAQLYDATNGTVSFGDIVIFSDIAGTGKNQ